MGQRPLATTLSDFQSYREPHARGVSAPMRDIFDDNIQSNHEEGLGDQTGSLLRRKLCLLNSNVAHLINGPRVHGIGDRLGSDLISLKSLGKSSPNGSIDPMAWTSPRGLSRSRN